jgi:DNA-directed RNA polymerase alpha subunit
METERNQKGIAKGVEGAFDFWLSQHDVTTPDCIVEGVKQAVAEFLEKNAKEIIAAVAGSIREPSAAKAIPAQPDVLDCEIEDLCEMGTRLRLVLRNESLFKIRDITTKTAGEVLSYRNFGENTLQELRRCLGALGVSLKGEPVLAMSNDVKRTVLKNFPQGVDS